MNTSTTTLCISHRDTHHRTRTNSQRRAQAARLLATSLLLAPCIPATAVPAFRTPYHCCLKTADVSPTLSCGKLTPPHGRPVNGGSKVWVVTSKVLWPPLFVPQSSCGSITPVYLQSGVKRCDTAPAYCAAYVGCIMKKWRTYKVLNKWGKCTPNLFNQLKGM